MPEEIAVLLACEEIEDSSSGPGQTIEVLDRDRIDVHAADAAPCGPEVTLPGYLPGPSPC